MCDSWGKYSKVGVYSEAINAAVDHFEEPTQLNFSRLPCPSLNYMKQYKFPTFYYKKIKLLSKIARAVTEDIIA